MLEATREPVGRFRLRCSAIAARAASQRRERRRKDEYATRNAPGSCRHSDAATIAETGRDFGMRGGTCSSDACNRLEHSARGAEGDAFYGRSASRYGRTAALVRRDAVERHACYRAGIFRQWKTFASSPLMAAAMLIDGAVDEIYDE